MKTLGQVGVVKASPSVGSCWSIPSYFVWFGLVWFATFAGLLADEQLYIIHISANWEISTFFLQTDKLDIFSLNARLFYVRSRRFNF